GDGAALDKFVGMFNPATDADQVLLKAMFVTLLWGGPPGRRPAFLVRALDGDRDAGRGAGKSTVAELMGLLFGKYVAVETGKDVPDLKTGLLSADSAGKRLVLWDNVKSDRISSADLEGLITADTVSGRKLYAGEGSRPNRFTYVLTVNGG